MTAVPLQIAPDDPVAPPRANGELTFAAPWQGRAFGICLAVLEQEGLGWDAFRSHLVAEIERDHGRDYYDAFVMALDRFVTEIGLRGEG